jgi:hypothetical protein
MSGISVVFKFEDFDTQISKFVVMSELLPFVDGCYVCPHFSRQACMEEVKICRIIAVSGVSTRTRYTKILSQIEIFSYSVNEIFHYSNGYEIYVWKNNS